MNEQILIGCEGANSAVAKFLELSPLKLFPMWSVRGLTNYPQGHGFAHEFARMRAANNVIIGRIPIDQQLVYWFVSREGFTRGNITRRFHKIFKIGYII